MGVSCPEAKWTGLGLGLFKSYFLINQAHSRLDGANMQSRVFGAWKGMEKEPGG